MHYFQQQLKLRKSARFYDGRTDFIFDTIGITNGCFDLLIQAPLYPHFAYNNTYGLQAISAAVAEAASLNFTKPGGCRDLMVQCRSLGEQEIQASWEQRDR